MRKRGFGNLLILFCLLVALFWLGYRTYFYVLHADELLYTTSGVIFYFLFPVIACLIFLGLLRLKREIQNNLALLIISVGLALYGFELFLDLKARDATVEEEPAGGKTRFELISGMRAAGEEVVPSMVPTDYVVRQLWDLPPEERQIPGPDQKVALLPLSSVSRVLTVLCNERGEWDLYQSDQYGFHNPVEAWSAPGVRIVAVGDSYLQGCGTPSDQNIAAYLRGSFPATINLGMLGNGPLLELAGLREYAQPLKPDVVLWFFYEGNDLKNLKLESSHPTLMAYLKHPVFNQRLLDRQAEIDNLVSGYIEKAYKSKKREVAGRKDRSSTRDNLVNFLKLRGLRDLLGMDAIGAKDTHVQTREEDVWKLLEQILQTASQATAADGGRFYFVYLSGVSRILTPDYPNAQRERTLALVKKLGIELIDITPVIAAQKDPYAFFSKGEKGGHYSAHGCEVTAEVIRQRLEADGFKPES